MKLSKDERAALNAAIDEAVADCEGIIPNASAWLEAELLGMEGGGVALGREVLRAATLAGLAALIRRRISLQRLAVGDQSMPARYTIGGASAKWLDVGTDELDPVIARLLARSRSYHEHAVVLMDAQRHASEHSVMTAAEAFEAEGVAITEVA